MTDSSEPVMMRPVRSPPTSPLSPHRDGNISARSMPTPSETKGPTNPSTSFPFGPLAEQFIAGPSHRRVSSSTHRRRPSSISLPHHLVGPLRTSDGPSDHSEMEMDFCSRSRLPSDFTLDIIGSTDVSTNPIPQFNPNAYAVSPGLDDGQDVTEVDKEEARAHSRMSAFSFGSKPVNHRGPSTTPSMGSKISPRPLSIAHSAAHSAQTSISEASRPPSLVVTAPLIPPHVAMGHHLPGTASSDDLPPNAPPRNRKHSHTRSNSISLPNLKLGRPTSLTASSLTSSFPSSPISPESDTTSHPSRVITSRRLKFEPSGRGAEADLAKEEARRRALETLTGTARSGRIKPSQVSSESNIESIVLPGLDAEDSIPEADDDSSHFRFGHPQSSPLPPVLDTILAAPATSTSPSSAISSSHPYPHASLARTSLPLMSRTPKLGSQGPSHEFERDMVAVSKRMSTTSALGVLQEEDESESASPTVRTIALSKGGFSVSPNGPAEPNPPVRESISTGLRQLRLLSPPSDKSTFQPNHSQSLFALSRLSTTDLGESSCTPTKRSPAVNRNRPHSLHLASPLATGDGSSPPSLGGLLTRSTRSRQSIGSSTPDRTRSRNGSLSYRKTPSGDDATQKTSDTSVFGDILTPSSRDDDLPRRLRSSDTIIDGDSTTAHHLSWGESSPWQRSDVTSSRRWSQPTHRLQTPLDHEVDSSYHKQRRPSSSDSISLNWQGSSLDMSIQMESLEEDRNMWRTRCMAAEAKLEEERRERAILQSRIRKLGDRLTSVSSGPNESLPLPHDPTADLRQQLYAATAALQHAQHAKLEALARIAELEDRVQGSDSQGHTSLAGPNRYMPRLPSSLFATETSPIGSGGEVQPRTSSPTPEMSAAEPSACGPPMSFESEYAGRSIAKDTQTNLDPPDRDATSNPYLDTTIDPTRNRMKAWGFPAPPRQKTPTKDHRRESFFGLSTVVTPPCEAEEHESGVDLPPFISGYDGPLTTDAVIPTPLSFSSYDAPPSLSSVPLELGLWPTFDKTTTTSYTPPDRNGAKNHVSADIMSDRLDHDLDFTLACRCCVGQVFVF